MMEIEDGDDPAEEADFRFRVGEEVLARLGRCAPTEMGAWAMPRNVEMPAWTIGEILARRWGGGAQYLLSFEHDGTIYRMWIAERAIDGTV
jgi:hypothetical protein